MTNNSPDNTKPATHSTDLVLDRVATISDIENRLPDSKEIWYGHSILTSTLFPATPPAEALVQWIWQFCLYHESLFH